jgi:type II secretory pathway pseudopilin PulG
MFTRTSLVSGSHATRSRGLTIVEMLVSLACVIILMLAYTQLFSDVGGRISDARSMIEVQTRMRSAANRLRTDLAAVTCDMLPWQRPEAGGGYFEILEGSLQDTNTLNNPTNWPASVLPFDSHFLGDPDDTLMFTVRSKEGPFTGRYMPPGATAPVTVQSEVAEVVWFMRPTRQADGVTPLNPPTFTLYRRVFLVMPTYQGNPTDVSSAAAGVTNPTNVTNPLLPKAAPAGTFYDNNDISVHLEMQGSAVKAVANTLGDLTKRECRYGHASWNDVNSANGFPHEVSTFYLVPLGGQVTSPGGNYITTPSNPRYGEDVVLTNVVAFDVKVWDPTAPVYNVNVGTPQQPVNVSVAPGDAWFTSHHPWGSPLIFLNPSSPTPTNPVPSSVGAFVDLNWLDLDWDGSQVPVPWNAATVGGPAIMSPFYSRGHKKSELTVNTSAIKAATYDTWSYHYEHDGINQSLNTSTGKVTGGTANADQGTDGFQDDVGKYETSPPYPVPLRGIKVIIRCYEPDSRQFHEVSVVESFVPE